MNSELKKERPTKVENLDCIYCSEKQFWGKNKILGTMMEKNNDFICMKCFPIVVSFECYYDQSFNHFYDQPSFLLKVKEIRRKEK